VVVVPAERLDRVAEAAQSRADSEQEILTRLRAGESTLDIFGLPAVPS
jgi:4-hydroxy-4-methyl-2-oxoglutarate aldolase